MWQSWPMIYNTGGLWCATRWFADQMCSCGKKKCTAQLNLPTINNLFLTQLLSEATREQVIFLWLEESCMCFERSEATLCLYPRWMNSITKIMPKFTLSSCQNQHFHRLDVISVYYLQFSELFNPQWKKTVAPKYDKTYVCCWSNIDTNIWNFISPRDDFSKENHWTFWKGFCWSYVGLVKSLWKQSPNPPYRAFIAVVMKTYILDLKM